MKRECETCIKRKTIYCPNYYECYDTKEMPHYQNRIMLLEENQKYKEVINKLREDLNLLIKYGDGEDASRWDKQYGEFAKNHLKYMDELLKEVK